MAILCIGLNHKTAPVELRERLAFAQNQLGAANLEITGLPGVNESVILSTCNRVEIYAHIRETDAGLAGIQKHLKQKFDCTFDEEHFYHLHNENVAQHLFSVAGGLDSMVLGETEIFGQVKQAYAAAQETGTTGRILNKLFQKSFQVGKLIRTKTQITRGPTSVGAVGVDLAEKIFGKLKRCRIMLLGAGDMGRRTAASLQSRGATDVIVCNRSAENAEALAKEIGGSTLPFEQWPKELQNRDILVTSLGTDKAVVLLEHVKAATKSRRGKPLFLIDIAVPRNIDPAVNELDGVYHYDMDALESMAKASLEHRNKQLKVCESLVSEQVNAFDLKAVESAPSKNERAQQRITLGTRGSALALTQTRHVKELLDQALGGGFDVRERVIKTIGDKRRDIKLSEFSSATATEDGPILDKGIFTKELETAIAAREVDCAVHSLKDVPTVLDPIFTISTVLPRVNSHDVIITKSQNHTLMGLPQGATIATSSVRRQAQLRLLRPDFELIDIRGNLPTRLRKLAETKGIDAIMLAEAGLYRLGYSLDLNDPIISAGTALFVHQLDPESFLPAAGQGAVAIECLKENHQIQKQLSKIHHQPTFQRISAERHFLELIQGGCETPVGAFTEITGNTMRLKVRLFNEDEEGQPPREAEVSGAADKPKDLAQMAFSAIQRK